ncbi:MAG TPA: hypothetical protein VMW41_06485 [Candidatus Bathyarchaeia archaeon]|nr:hypothetical protein [Candidatus Bathyarchaeia archaeon]
MYPILYPEAFKVSYLIFIIPTVIVTVTAVLSAKEMGGSLGRGLKKIAAGTIINTSLVTALLVLEQFYPNFYDESLIKYAFAANGLIGSIFLILGFVQVYKITKRFKLFTP